MRKRWASSAGLAFGGDYNPEQWPRHVWAEDLELMQQAGVNLVSVAIFSWAWLEPEEGRYEFTWLDDVIAGLDDAGIAVDLATATASPPPWLTTRHPEVLPVTAEGVRLHHGSRQAWCPSSPVFRERAVALAGAMAERYGHHDGVVLWHVSNELGCHNAQCHCDVSVAAFRRWLEDRHGDLDELNEAWGTAFWSQRYGSWDEVSTPRATPTFRNPGQVLDYRRFCSDELLDHYRAERDAIRRHDRDTPITTNFMVQRFISDLDYWSWADEVDVVTNDHYLDAADPDAHVELAFSADVCRGLARGREWLLLEHSTSAVNWQPRNVPKRPGQLLRNSLQHVARGSDGALFFQWRASVRGAEAFHSALVPHAGTDTWVWEEAVELGDALRRLGPVSGRPVDAQVALLFDWQSWWASELPGRPSQDTDYRRHVEEAHGACWRAGVTVDVLPPDGEFERYDVVVVPHLYLAADGVARRLSAQVEGGGHVLVTYLSGIVDPDGTAVRTGGYPGAFRELLGIRVEEFHPLLPDQRITLDDGTTATTWIERLHLAGAEPVTSYADGPLEGVPAVTRRRVGDGTAWYVACRLDRDGMDRLVHALLTAAGRPPRPPAPGLEQVVRSGDGSAPVRFAINHGPADADVEVEGRDLLTDERVGPVVVVPAGGVRVVEEAVP